LRSNTKVYSDKTHYTDSQNGDTTAASGTELYHMQFSFQAVSPETFGYTLVHNGRISCGLANIKIWCNDRLLSATDYISTQWIITEYALQCTPYISLETGATDDYVSSGQMEALLPFSKGYCYHYLIPKAHNTTEVLQ